MNISFEDVKEEIEQLKDEKEKLSKEIITETCFLHLRDFLTIFDQDTALGNKEWVKKESAVTLANNIRKFVDDETELMKKYFEIEDEYNHLLGSALAGHAHTHKFGKNHEHE